MDDNTRNVWEWGLFMMPFILFGVASIIHAWRKPREEDEK